MYGLIE